ncbi:phosphopantetheine-binding protein [Anaerocolumna sp. MB42-C2]|uniref:phosphopantetheine-binding protein n=1 Tax=Anaerocolumna sp. MB42-C2 TaxID=3070997 RepID=UPI0027E1B407|nr:phosphopantetheine-binding protein [Anaerocolumna sp. MB42-C2]WMJ86446.1 phosphopantetheine-binding protein [Anaerocolumna sp. MB42-C2]
MGSNNVRETIREIIYNLVELKKPINEIDDNENILILGMDSISILKVVTELEDEYNIEFDDEDLNYDNLKSINSMIDCVEKYRRMGMEER